MIIKVFNQQKDLKISKSSVRALVKSTLEFQGVIPEEVAIYFISTRKIADLHAQFFNDPTPTDCITFPPEEVFVCPATAIEYAGKKNLCPYRETTLYIVHGLLHLLGFDDIEPNARRTMRKKEKSCMGNLDKQQIKLTAT